MGKFLTRLMTELELTMPWSSSPPPAGLIIFEGKDICELDSDAKLYLLKLEGVILPSTSTY